MTAPVNIVLAPSPTGIPVALLVIATTFGLASLTLLAAYAGH